MEITIDKDENKFIKEIYNDGIEFNYVIDKDGNKTAKMIDENGNEISKTVNKDGNITTITEIDENGNKKRNDYV